jgi:TolB-like protein/Tfp pilus assembly protein PilF
MKRCPECRRDYYDDSLLYCLDDGSALLEGPASADEPATAILSEPLALAGGPTSESPTRQQVHANAAEAVPRKGLDVLAARESVSANRIAKPLAVLVVVVVMVVGGFLSYRYLWAANSKQIGSIAVMPFVNESGSADMEYLADGMTETLIRALSQLPDLNVKARSSVFRYKGKNTETRTIGKELGVQAVLNGDVIQRGDQLVLNLELIDPLTENVIWTDSYDRRSSDLVSLQNEIARDVSTRLRLKLSGADQQRLNKSYTTDSEVYRLYLQGRYYWNKRTPSEVEKAVQFFQQAVARDPAFALGYVGLADTDEDRDRPVKKEYIRRALGIDDQLAEAHASLGYQYMLDYDWAASERELKRAMELNPNYPQSYAWNGARLMMIGKYDASLREIEHALELDPTSNGINFYKGVCLGVAGQRQESIMQFKKLIEIDPAFPWAHSHLSRVYKLNGDDAAAAEERAISFELDGRSDLAAGTRQEFAKGGWGALERYMAANSPPEAFYTGIVTGEEKDKWIAKLEREAGRGNFWLFLIKTEPRFDPLRGDPRFEALMRKFDPPQ